MRLVKCILQYIVLYRLLSEAVIISAILGWLSLSEQPSFSHVQDVRVLQISSDHCEYEVCEDAKNSKDSRGACRSPAYN